MKRILGILLLMGVMMTPTIASASEQVGVYVAPKFIYGLTQMKGFKGHFKEGANSASFKGGNKTDSVFGGALAIGYDFGKNFTIPIRTELEYAVFSKGSAKKTYSPDATSSATMKQTFGIQTLFLNTYWDITTGTKLTPYVGAGLGIASITTKFKDSGNDTADGPWNEKTGSKNVTNFAWNVGAGLGYDLTENWAMDIGYRFVGLGSVKTKKRIDPEDDASMYGKTSNLYQHQVTVGVRYTF